MSASNGERKMAFLFRNLQALECVPIGGLHCPYYCQGAQNSYSTYASQNPLS